MICLPNSDKFNVLMFQRQQWMAARTLSVPHNLKNRWIRSFKYVSCHREEWYCG